MIKQPIPDDTEIPPLHNWRTTDADEIARRQLRARTESFAISNIDAHYPIFSNFRVRSRSGMSYSVEITDLRQRQFSCTCVDFRINGLGTCKHVEAVLNFLKARFRRMFETGLAKGSSRVEVTLDSAAATLRVSQGLHQLPEAIKSWFDAEGRLKRNDIERVVEDLLRLRDQERVPVRLSQDIEPWLVAQRQLDERKTLRREYEIKVQRGEWPPQETLVPLFPYQREGMLHLAFTERALLADEMGLGKTIQAIAACALLRRLGKVERVLVVTPASLKTEWEEQIQRFTGLSYQLVFGARHQRLKHYVNPPFFTITNYEQMVKDSLDVNERLRPDAVILDEAQRIKNWNTKTSQAIKRLRSRYAFVLTGTPIENRIDELFSLMDFLQPSVLGPLFRFNREYYDLDDRGRPIGYRNLDRLHEQIKSFLVRRRKIDVETELPDRSDRQHFVALHPRQRAAYAEREAVVARLAMTAKRRPLSQQEQERLMINLAMMRMICDSNYILDQEDRVCPKLVELEKILEQCRDNHAKVIVFSEWERMLELVRDLCRELELGYAWHTGSVPQKRRRTEINAFKTDPRCRVFLSTDSGSTGLNLQNASVVVNCDLPWNPAKLEQRIARAWRKHQTQAVTVVNLVAQDTIEHRMLATLADKSSLSAGVLDRQGNLKEIKLRSGKQAFLSKLEQILAQSALPADSALRQGTISNPSTKPPPLADRSLAFALAARQVLGSGLVRCEERFPIAGEHSVLLAVVQNNVAQCRQKLEMVHAELFGPGQGDPGSLVQLQIIDQASLEALDRLIAAGLITSTLRVARMLELPDQGATALVLSDAERARADTHRQQAARKLKMAVLLGEGGLEDETQPALREAAFACSRALAVENRLPEPAQLEDVITPPWSRCWGERLSVIASLVRQESKDWRTLIACLEGP